MSVTGFGVRKPADRDSNMPRPSKSSSGAGGLAGRIVVRWVWVAWSAAVAAMLLGLVLWIVRGVLRGVPGPVVSGAYVEGGIDALIVLAYVATGVTIATIAAVLASRVPRNAIGWILGGVAVWHAATFLLGMSLYFLHAPGAAETNFGNWLGSWTFVVPASASLVLILFPTGTLPSSRWRVLGWLALIGTMAWAVLEATGDYLGADVSVPNPFANASVNTIANVASVTLLPALIGTIASLVTRYRRSSREARLQIKWVAFGGLVAILVWIMIWVWSVAWPKTFDATAIAIGTVATLITPVALAVAILKHRLYDIERLVSRTVSYALLVAVLAGTYALGVIGMQTLFPWSGNLAVAGTTLVIAAVFNPLRRRLHDLMDRRFNRRHFDAALVMAAFAARIGTVSHTEELAAGLTTVLEQTLAPSSVGLWIRE